MPTMVRLPNGASGKGLLGGVFLVAGTVSQRAAPAATGATGGRGARAAGALAAAELAVADAAAGLAVDDAAAELAFGDAVAELAFAVLAAGAAPAGLGVPISGSSNEIGGSTPVSVGPSSSSSAAIPRLVLGPNGSPRGVSTSLG